MINEKHLRERKLKNRVTTEQRTSEDTSETQLLGTDKEKRSVEHLGAYITPAFVKHWKKINNFAWQEAAQVAQQTSMG